MLIAGIISPGKKKNGKKCKPKLHLYQRLLVDQLLQGWRDGFAFTDIHKREVIRRLKLILQIADYPGMCELNLQTSHSGSFGTL